MMLRRARWYVSRAIYWLVPEIRLYICRALLRTDSRALCRMLWTIHWWLGPSPDVIAQRRQREALDRLKPSVENEVKAK